MARLELVQAGTEVLEPGEKTLGELAEIANHENAMAIAAGHRMFDHAVNAGLALTAAKAQLPHGEWMPWVEANLEIALATASRYMRFAAYQDEIREAMVDPTIRGAERFLRGLPRADHCADDARLLSEAGVTQEAIAAQLGVSRTTVQCWLNPAFERRYKDQARRKAHRRRMAAQTLRERERERAIKRAVRKAGTATQEAWTMAERFQDVLAQAQRETEDREAREALSKAGEHYRKMRDEIVRALGVS